MGCFSGFDNGDAPNRYQVIRGMVSNIMKRKLNQQQLNPVVGKKHAHPPRVIYCAIYATLTN